MSMTRIRCETCGYPQAWCICAQHKATSAGGTPGLLTGVARSLGRLVSVFKRDKPTTDWWEPRFYELADYNSEVAKGLCHTEETRVRMEKMQREYDEKIKNTPGVIFFDANK